MQSFMVPRVAAGSQITVRRVVPYMPLPGKKAATGPETLRPETLRTFAESEFSEYPVSTFLTGDELRLASK